MSSALHVVSAGEGPRALLIHGSAADHTTWQIQLARGMRDRFTLVAYDRPIRDSVEAHARDAASLVGDGPVLVVGSSFGAVIALELVRTGGAVAGAVLIEPPMVPADDAPVPLEFLAAYDRRVAEQGGPAAAELFLRTVLGDAAFMRMPQAYRERATSKWAEIRADSAALMAYQPRYAELATVDVPVLLVGGERSAPVYRPTLMALHAALPRARLEMIPNAGHMLHAEAYRRFAELVIGFAEDIGFAPALAPG